MRFSVASVLLALVCSTFGADYTVQNTNDTGPGSLRAAIEAANANAGRDRVLFGEQVRGSIYLISPLPEVNGSLDIAGPGSTNLALMRSEVTSNLRFFTVPVGSSLTISNLSLRRGSFAEGGAILNFGNLEVANSILAQNQATYAFGSGGGAILNRGTLFLTNTLISSNYSANWGGGVMNLTGMVSVAQSSFADNTAVSGGGIGNQSGTVICNGTSVVRNKSFSGGGGLINYFGDLRMTNATLSANFAQGPDGGAGILASFGNVFVSFSTIVNNDTSNTGFGGGIRNEVPANTYLDNSIVAFNTAPRGPDLYGRFDSGDYNLVHRFESVTWTGPTGNSLFGQDPGISLLSSHGILEVHHLQTGSPAIDRADPTNFPPVDQILTFRPHSTRADLGAIEAVIAPPITSFWFFEGKPTLGFTSTPGWTYFIDATEQLGQPWREVHGPIEGGGQIVFQDTTGLVGQRFYRVRASRQ